MSKIALKRVASEIRKKRVLVGKMKKELDDLTDYLDVLESRARDDGKRYTSKEIKNLLLK